MLIKGMMLSLKKQVEKEVVEKLTGESTIESTKQQQFPEITLSQLNSNNVVITGEIDGYDRIGIIRKLTESGGIVHSTISRNIDYLIAGKKPAQNKIDFAQQNNIPIVNISI